MERQEKLEAAKSLDELAAYVREDNRTKIQITGGATLMAWILCGYFQVGLPWSPVVVAALMGFCLAGAVRANNAEAKEFEDRAQELREQYREDVRRDEEARGL